MNHYVKILRSAFLAGLCISVGCVVNLRVGGVAGAVLFSFGLLAVLHYKLKLYTGTAGFIRVRSDWSMLVAVLLGNIIAPPIWLLLGHDWPRALWPASCWPLAAALS